MAWAPQPPQGSQMAWVPQHHGQQPACQPANATQADSSYTKNRLGEKEPVASKRAAATQAAPAESSRKDRDRKSELAPGTIGQVEEA